MNQIDIVVVTSVFKITEKKTRIQVFIRTFFVLLFLAFSRSSYFYHPHHPITIYSMLSLNFFNTQLLPFYDWFTGLFNRLCIFLHTHTQTPSRGFSYITRGLSQNNRPLMCYDSLGTYGHTYMTCFCTFILL